MVLMMLEKNTRISTQYTLYLYSRVSEEGSYLMNGVKIRATISDQDGHLWDPEGEGTRTVASRRVKNTMSEGKGKGCGGPATWRDRRERERERTMFKSMLKLTANMYLSLSDVPVYLT